LCTYTVVIDSERCAITRGLDELEGPAERHAGAAQRGVEGTFEKLARTPSVSANGTRKIPSTTNNNQNARYEESALDIPTVEPQMCHLGLTVILLLH
jgi:hypothetical protein